MSLHSTVPRDTHVSLLLLRRYESSFMAILTTASYLILPDRIAKFLVEQLSGFLLTGDSLDFILEQYTPALKKAFEDSNVRLCIISRLRLASAGVGVMIKVVSRSGSWL